MKLPSAILLFIPNSFFTFDAAKLIWILTNIASTVVFGTLSARLFCPRQATIFKSGTFILLLISSTPWRITIGIGQHGLVAMALFMVSLYFYRQHRIKFTIIFSSLALIKYTLVLPFFAFFWCRKKDAILVTCSVLFIHIILTVVAGFLVAEDPVTLVLQSLKVASTNAGNGAFDFFGFQSRVAPDLGPTIPIIASATVVALTLAISRSEVGTRELCIVSIASIILVYHRIYDTFVLILLALHLGSIYKTPSTRRDVFDTVELFVGCFILLYTFYLDRILYALVMATLISIEAYNFILSVVSAVLYMYLSFLFYRAFRASGTQPQYPASVSRNRQLSQP
jgi:hypothetical protein